MKSAQSSPQSPTGQIYGRVVSLCAPCRNRTYNLMIKSQIREVALSRTGSAQPSLAPSNVVALVPQRAPKVSRTSPFSPLAVFGGEAE